MSTFPERSAAPRSPATPGLSAGAAPMRPSRDGEGSLAHVVETLLDKGLVLNADIMVSVAGVELLGIRLRAALASFETAARYGLEFPSGTDTETAAWREARAEKETCPECGKRAPVEQLLNQWCPWCGWRSAQARHGQRGAQESPRAVAGAEEDRAVGSGRCGGEASDGGPDADDRRVAEPGATRGGSE
ncbi:gas vesicle protein [Streptomyces sp. JW3]|uniref:gas vesicle protein n=1 Tax=Streptomyces sp. JW3 TaxID=3456955 RepID=UPI003FA44531